MDSDCELIHSRTIYQTGTLEEAEPSAKPKKAASAKGKAGGAAKGPARKGKTGRRAVDKDSWPRILVTTVVLLSAAVGAVVMLRSF